MTATLLDEAGQPALATCKIRSQGKGQSASPRTGVCKIPQFTVPKSLADNTILTYDVLCDDTALVTFGIQLHVLAERPRQWSLSSSSGAALDSAEALGVPAQLPLQLGRIDQHGNAVSTPLGEALWPKLVLQARDENVKLAVAASGTVAAAAQVADGADVVELLPEAYKAFCRCWRGWIEFAGRLLPCCCTCVLFVSCALRCSMVTCQLLP